MSKYYLSVANGIVYTPPLSVLPLQFKFMLLLNSIITLSHAIYASMSPNYIAVLLYTGNSCTALCMAVTVVHSNTSVHGRSVFDSFSSPSHVSPLLQGRVHACFSCCGIELGSKKKRREGGRETSLRKEMNQ